MHESTATPAARVPSLSRHHRPSAPLHRVPAVSGGRHRGQSHRGARPRCGGGPDREELSHHAAEPLAVPRSPARRRRPGDLPRRGRDAARSARADRAPSRAVASLRERREPEPDVVLQGPALLGGHHARGRVGRAGDRDLVHGEPRRFDGSLRRPRRPAVRDLHSRVGAGHDEDADAGLRGRGDCLRHLRAALAAAARGRRTTGLVSDGRVRDTAHRLESVRDRGLQDARVRGGRGSRLDGARSHRRSQLVRRRALRHLEGHAGASHPQNRRQPPTDGRRRAVRVACRCAREEARDARARGGRRLGRLLDRLAAGNLSGAQGPAGLPRRRRAYHGRGGLRSPAHAGASSSPRRRRPSRP